MGMNNTESFDFIQKYFDEVFNKRNVDALDVFLDREYFDDDIGDPEVDHIQNSKDYLIELFDGTPAIRVDVKDTITRDNVISAFLEWFVCENSQKRVIRKGVAIFVVEGRRIRKRHTFIYFEE